MPLPICMQRKFLFGLRKLMLELDWSPFEFYVYTNDYSLPINDFNIVHATANGQVFDIQWIENWETRLDDSKLTALISEVRAKLAIYKKAKCGDQDGIYFGMIKYGSERFHTIYLNLINALISSGSTDDS